MVIDVGSTLQEVRFLAAVADLQRGQFQRHAAASPGRAVGPHVRAHMYLCANTDKNGRIQPLSDIGLYRPLGERSHLQVAFGGERLQAHGAPERFVARVRPHVYLERGRRREVLVAHVAQVFGRSCAGTAGRD